MTDTETERRLRRSRQLAILLDGAWGIPYTPWRFGLDALLGLLPVAGDLLSALLGLGVIVQARKLKAPQSLQLKMLGNIALDFLLGSVPIIGDIADVAFRKNMRNVALLEAWVAAVDAEK
ncbi:DUF4112 domain-containing protein [Zhongshania sp.]|uniref:DUF4112 domain-containing protein n=1 Tax=Zhongshania sp. TaxID=1971902 RepID=UPI0035691665